MSRIEELAREVAEDWLDQEYAILIAEQMARAVLEECEKQLDTSTIHGPSGGNISTAKDMIEFMRSLFKD